MDNNICCKITMNAIFLIKSNVFIFYAKLRKKLKHKNILALLSTKPPFPHTFRNGSYARWWKRFHFQHKLRHPHHARIPGSL